MFVTNEQLVKVHEKHLPVVRLITKPAIDFDAWFDYNNIY